MEYTKLIEQIHQAMIGEADECFADNAELFEQEYRAGADDEIETGMDLIEEAMDYDGDSLNNINFSAGRVSAFREIINMIGNLNKQENK